MSFVTWLFATILLGVEIRGKYTNIDKYRCTTTKKWQETELRDIAVPLANYSGWVLLLKSWSNYNRHVRYFICAWNIYQLTNVMNYFSVQFIVCLFFLWQTTQALLMLTWLCLAAKYRTTWLRCSQRYLPYCVSSSSFSVPNNLWNTDAMVSRMVFSVLSVESMPLVMYMLNNCL